MAIFSLSNSFTMAKPSKFGDGKKVTAAPKGYKKAGEENGRTYYQSPKNIKQAKPTDNPDGGAAYESFLQKQLASGVTPEQLAEAKYIAPTAIEKYRSFYKPDVVYTEPEAAAQPLTDIALGKGTNVDRKLITTGNTDYQTFQYPDVNLGYSGATTRHFDPTTQREIDPLKSYANGKYSPSFIGDGPSAGTLKNNVPAITDAPVENDAANPVKTFSAGFKDGGKVKPLAKYYKGYAAGGSIGYNERFQAANQINPQTGAPVQSNGQNKGLTNQQKLMGINLAGQGLGAIGGPQDTNMQYGTNQYFNNRNQNLQQGQGVANAVGAIPIVGAFKSFGEGAQNAIAKKDAYGVSDSSNLAIAAGGFLNPLESTTSAFNDIKNGKVTGDTALNLLLPGVGAIRNNKKNKAERDKLMAEDAAAQADEAKKQDYLRRDARANEAIAMRDAGELGYDDGYRKDPQSVAALNSANEGLKGMGAAAGVYNSLNSGSLLDRGKNLFKLMRGKKDGGQIGYAEGGEIKGKGTSTSDSINAQVEEGSFIVPAKNSNIAKLVRKEVLKKPINQKADIKQKGGTPVKLSNGEIQFTPEERAEIDRELGADFLPSLAPDAQNEFREYLNCGGMIKGYKDGGGVDPKAELAKINANKKSAAAKRESDYKADRNRKEVNNIVAKSNREKALAKLEYDRLSKGIDMLNDEYRKIQDREANKDKRLIGESDDRIEAEKVRVLNQMSKLMDERDGSQSASQTANPQNKVGGIDYFSGRNMDAELPSATGESVEASLEPQRGADLLGKPKKVTKVTQQRPGLTSEPGIFSRDWATTDPGPSIVPNNVQPERVTLNQNTPVVTNPSITPADANASGANADMDKGNKRFNYDNILGNALNYGIPLAQIAIGQNRLNKAGERPVDKINDDVLQSVDRANIATKKALADAKYGYTGDELSLLNMQNRNATNAARASARQYSGGNAAVALGMERSIANDEFGRSLTTRINDNALKMQKQQIANDRQQYQDQLINHKQELSRRLFSDTSAAWQQNQLTAGQLQQAGFANLMDANRLSQFQNMYNKVNTQQ